MAQLRYTKYVAVCGTAALTAGLVGLYLYKRRGAKRDDKPSVGKNNDIREKVREVEKSEGFDTQKEDSVLHGDSSLAVEELVSTSTQAVAQAKIEEALNKEDAQDMFAVLDSIEPTSKSSPKAVPAVEMPIEEEIAQSVQTSVESAPPQCQVLPEACQEVTDESLTLDWAATMEQVQEKKDESLVSPTMSLHSHPEGSLAGSDLSTETNSDNSSFDSGRCTGSVTSTGAQQTTQAPVREMPTYYQFEFPANECGRLIGKGGKNIKGIRNRSGAKVTLHDWPEDETKQICLIEGFQSEIDAALADIQKRFPDVDTSRQYVEEEQTSSSGVPPPEMTQIHLPDEIVNDIIVSSVVSAGHVFIQQPTHPTYMALNRLNAFMNNCYSQMDATPPLPRPIEVGVICAAPMVTGWYRAQIVEVYPDTDEVDLKFLDYGGYARTETFALKQIRTDFMSLPFQANECYMANIAPLAGEEDFSETARVFVEQVAQNFSVLQAKVTSYSEDGIPFVELFYTDSERNVQSLNRELLNQGLVSWYEEGIEDLSGDASLHVLPEVQPTPIEAQ